MRPILPGATLGILGSGQLGRMLALAAKRLGYRVAVYSPEEDAPAGQVADWEVSGCYEDDDAIRSFARRTDVITVEFENIPVRALERTLEFAPVRPGPQVLHVAQNRLREKAFLTQRSLPVTPFAEIERPEQLGSALDRLGAPAVVKTAGFGYDGKGQRVVKSLAEARAACAELGVPAILEAFVPYQQELSVVAARTEAGDYADFGVTENEHRNHILDVSLVPSSLPEKVQREARELARATLEAFEVVGVMCVEMFLGERGQLLINEVAPRPHNSGHLTIEAFSSSQFEQQLRAVCGLPLGRAEPLRPAAMANLLGELWHSGEPDWARLLAQDVHLHLYGKAEARPGRKMGHITALAESAGEARAKVLAARASLNRA